MEQFKTMAGVDMVHVPYKGTTGAMVDMMGGQIQATCAAAPALPPVTQGGEVRALGVTTRQPTRLVPGLPTIAEAVPGYELLGWYGLFLPLATPRELVRKINADVVAALKRPDIQEQLLAVGVETVGSEQRNDALRKIVAGRGLARNQMSGKRVQASDAPQWPPAFAVEHGRFALLIGQV